MAGAPSPAVARARFAQWTARVLRDARARGLTDGGIEKATGIGKSTFHRWQTSDGGLPSLDKIMAFCIGLDESPVSVLRALGADNVREPTPPTIDPDMARIMRRLADPAVSANEKMAIRAMLRLIARQTAVPPDEPESTIG